MQRSPWRNRSRDMLSRRLLLLAGLGALAGGMPAAGAAEVKHHETRGRGKKGQEQRAGTPADTPLGPLDTAAKQALVVDFNSGATLLAKEADTPMVPSSMTKLMTAYIVYGTLKAGRLNLDQQLPVTERAWKMGGSKMFVQVGDQVKVEDLIRGMIVQSGNDACIVLAEGIAG